MQASFQIKGGLPYMEKNTKTVIELTGYYDKYQVLGLCSAHSNTDKPLP